jgi:hypothetical protein
VPNFLRSSTTGALAGDRAPLILSRTLPIFPALRSVPASTVRLITARQSFPCMHVKVPPGMALFCSSSWLPTQLDNHQYAKLYKLVELNLRRRGGTIQQLVTVASCTGVRRRRRVWAAYIRAVIFGLAGPRFMSPTSFRQSSPFFFRKSKQSLILFPLSHLPAHSFLFCQLLPSPLPAQLKSIARATAAVGPPSLSPVAATPLPSQDASLSLTYPPFFGRRTALPFSVSPNADAVT